MNSSMTLFSLFVLALGLSMDAFAVAVCKGLSMKQISIKSCTIVGLYFGVFQAGMPLLGYILGNSFRDRIESVDHWIAFILLCLIGLNMLIEGIRNKEESTNASLDFKSMVVLAVATSIDALAIGVTFAFLKVSIIPAVSLIGVTTFTLSFFGVKIGNLFGAKYKSRAEIAGGAILIIMGVKILLEHLNLFPF